MAALHSCARQVLFPVGEKYNGSNRDIYYKTRQLPPKTWPWEPQTLFLCFGRNLQFAHLHWTLSTGSHSQFLCQKVRKGNGFLYLKGVFHIQEEKLYSSTDIPQPRFQSLLSASHCQDDVFSKLLIRYKHFKGLFCLSPVIWFCPLQGGLHPSWCRYFPLSSPQFPTAAHGFPVLCCSLCFRPSWGI